jgi:solute carrier family 10 (sodium/bile acid cotransporter), member 7
VNWFSTVLALVRRYWLFLAIVLVASIASSLGGRGAWVQDYPILTVAIFLAFFVTGLSLDTSYLGAGDLPAKAAVAAIVSSLGLIPLISWILASYLLPLEFTIGVCIIATAPVSIISGTVMTAIGRGNIALSLLICLLGNSIGVFTVPFSLQLMVGGVDNLDLPILKMLMGLVTTVLVPLVLGKIAQPALRNFIKRYKGVFSIFQQCVVLLIIFNAFASSGSKISASGTILPALFAFVVFLHVLILLLNYAISKVIRLDRSSTTAFTIHTSQKTLGVSYLVWAGSFAAQYPLALVPGILYHLTQMVMDTFVAERFKTLSVRQEKYNSHAGQWASK